MWGGSWVMERWDRGFCLTVVLVVWYVGVLWERRCHGAGLLLLGRCVGVLFVW